MYMGTEIYEQRSKGCECGGTVSLVSEGGRKINLIKVFALSCICPSSADASGRASQSLSPPNEGQAHASAAVIVTLKFSHQLSENHPHAFVCYRVLSRLNCVIGY